MYNVRCMLPWLPAIKGGKKGTGKWSKMQVTTNNNMAVCHNGGSC